MLFIPNKVSNKSSTSQTTQELPLLDFNMHSINTRSKANDLYYSSFISNVNNSECEKVSFISLSETGTANAGNRKATPDEIFHAATFKMKRRKSSTAAILNSHKLEKNNKSKLSLNKIRLSRKSNFSKNTKANFSLHAASDSSRKIALVASEKMNCVYLLVILALVFSLSTLFIGVLIVSCNNQANRLCYSLL